MGTKFDYDKLGEYLTYDKHSNDLAYVDYKITSSIDDVSYSIGQLKDRVDYEANRIDELFALIRSVLDAQTEKPKQKWLWEIFEPNDIEIDFSYNL